MSQLDDRAWVTRNDPLGMLSLFEAFPKQCREALMISENVEPPALANRPGLVCLTGMGGSASGGDFARMLFEEQGATPFLVNRDYHLPNFVGVGDLVFCCSYSGNTEETLSAYAEARRSGARIVVVTSGGKLAELAKADGVTLVIIPGGSPPRAALGYLLIPVLALCRKLRLLNDLDFEGAFNALEGCVAQWSVEAKKGNAAKALAEALQGRTPVLYGLGGWQGIVANRWKTQINENAKCLAIAASYPEIDHNEILGWMSPGEQKFAIVTLQGGAESAKMKARAKFTAELIGDKAAFFDAISFGDTLLEKMLTLASLGDFVSIYLAALNGVDPGAIDWLDRLKGELSKID